MCSEYDTNYFGSLLNVFAHEECTKQMTVNNIDCIIFRRSKNQLRIIESKHSNEHWEKSQDELLYQLRSVFNFWNVHHNTTHPRIRELKCSLYRLRGDSPYNTCKIDNILTGETHTLTRTQLKAFLEFDYDPIG